MIISQQNSLSSLSDSQIINRLDTLVQKERKTTLEVLRHLIEMDHRSLYLEKRYTSLYEYCTRNLGYSESAAFRRIQTARCIRDFPDVYELLLKNELNLTTVSKLTGILTDENKDTLLKEARGKSTRQVEAIVARNNPRNVIRERVRPVFVKSFHETPLAKSESQSGSMKNECTQIDDVNHKQTQPENWVKFTSGAGGKILTTSCSTRTQMPVLEQKFKLEFAVSQAFMKKIEEAKALLSKKYPRDVSFEQLFEVVLAEYLDKHSPERKIHRRKQRKSKANVHRLKASTVTETNKTRTPSSRANDKDRRNTKRSRHIPEAVRDKVYTRDGGRCVYVGAAGKRCNSTWNLQIDHIEPFARGGQHKIQNLRLLCAKHNRYEAKRIYGRGFMEQRMIKQTPKRE
jgi:5-methylcytosine-specific restriction endonuclease McrA